MLLNDGVALIRDAIILGIGATVFMDIWALVLWHVFGVPSLDYALVGRWIGHLRHGTWIHPSIMRAEPLRYERPAGWIAHYLIGIVFAGGLLLICGREWLLQPDFPTALITGLVTLVAPFFILQPGMGAGIAASKTPHPNKARMRSLLAHTGFGVGLYIAALLLS